MYLPVFESYFDNLSCGINAITEGVGSDPISRDKSLGILAHQFYIHTRVGCNNIIWLYIINIVIILYASAPRALIMCYW